LQGPLSVLRFDLAEVLGRYSKIAKLDIAAPRIHAAKRRLGSAKVAQLVADYQAGQTTTQLMTTYRIGKGTVLRLLETAGVPRRNQPLTPKQCAEAITLYPAGLVTGASRPALRAGSHRHPPRLDPRQHPTA
jgi:hypothetical protein